MPVTKEQSDRVEEIREGFNSDDFITFEKANEYFSDLLSVIDSLRDERDSLKDALESSTKIDLWIKLRNMEAQCLGFSITSEQRKNKIEYLKSKVSSLEESADESLEEYKIITEKWGEGLRTIKALEAEKEQLQHDGHAESLKVYELTAENKEYKEAHRVIETDVKKWMVWHDELEDKLEQAEEGLHDLVGCYDFKDPNTGYEEARKILKQIRGEKE